MVSRRVILATIAGHTIKGLLPGKVRNLIRRFFPRPRADGRVFRYDRTLLPNRYLAELEAETRDLPAAKAKTGLSIGYPAWNLLYYTLLCSLSPGNDEAVIIETGTNAGFSTIILAQALKDSGRPGIVRTVEISPDAVATARENVERAGLSRKVEFHVRDSLEYLGELIPRLEHVDFAFLDGSHEFDVVRREFEFVHPLVVCARGKVFFDNTSTGGVGEALSYIRNSYGGNLIEFESSSWSPPGDAIWQP